MTTGCGIKFAIGVNIWKYLGVYSFVDSVLILNGLTVLFYAQLRIVVIESQSWNTLKKGSITY